MEKSQSLFLLSNLHTKVKMIVKEEDKKEEIKMKKIALLVFITFFLSIASVYAKTLGDIWNKLDPVTKQFIVIGYKEGLRDGLAIAKEPDAKEPAEITTIDTHQHIVADGTYKNVFTTHLNIIVLEMDKFYANSANAGVPLDYAILNIIQTQNGVPKKEAQRDLIERKNNLQK